MFNPLRVETGPMVVTIVTLIIEFTVVVASSPMLRQNPGWCWFQIPLFGWLCSFVLVVLDSVGRILVFGWELFCFIIVKSPPLIWLLTG